MGKHPLTVSFRYAASGIRQALKTERNFRLHLLAFLGILGIAWLAGWSRVQLAIIIIVSFCVIALEMMNTALEALEDVVHPDQHLAIQRSKDMAAGAVFIMSIGALLVAVLFITG